MNLLITHDELDAYLTLAVSWERSAYGQLEYYKVDVKLPSPTHCRHYEEYSVGIRKLRTIGADPRVIKMELACRMDLAVGDTATRYLDAMRREQRTDVRSALSSWYSRNPLPILPIVRA